MPDPHTFKFLGGPVDDPSEAQVLFLELGRATAAWARLEQQVEAILVHVNKKEFSEELFKEHPVSFTTKLKILKPWFKKHQALSKYKEAVLEVSSKLWNLAEERNLYLHSVLETFDSQSNIAVFHRIIPKGNNEFALILNEVPLERISSFVEVVNLTNRYLWSVSQDLFIPETVSGLAKR
ncbi:hypothetical protein SAMN05216603_1292 [Pseudomonas benzenivorans]|nr:hypothetical protein [Pseudomonas benzenivorans]SDI25262.1 hypothetical protein SAMN05216603_1292 [Pseudomonas benzenivorans]